MDYVSRPSLSIIPIILHPKLRLCKGGSNVRACACVVSFFDRLWLSLARISSDENERMTLGVSAPTLFFERNENARERIPLKFSSDTNIEEI